MWKYYNPNPHNKSTGDCVIRAITKVIGADWDTVYVLICAEGFLLKELPPTDNVWRSFLSKNGFHRYMVQDAVIDGYTVKQFCKENPEGTFLLFVGEHVIAVIDGDYYDTWDSGDEIPSFFWRKER